MKNKIAYPILILPLIFLGIGCTRSGTVSDIKNTEAGSDSQGYFTAYRQCVLDSISYVDQQNKDASILKSRARLANYDSLLIFNIKDRLQVKSEDDWRNVILSKNGDCIATILITHTQKEGTWYEITIDDVYRKQKMESASFTSWLGEDTRGIERFIKAYSRYSR